MKLIINNIFQNPFDKEFSLDNEVCKVLKITNDQIISLEILKKSIDARNKNNVKYLYRVLVKVKSDKIDFSNKDVLKYERPDLQYSYARNTKKTKKTIIVGMGPAGIFAALRLIDAGFKVTIFERGKCVEERLENISKSSKTGIIDKESNVLFGEGGAGTWSDGKLTTRIHKPGIQYFFDRMVEFGADEKILFEAKPHIGSDKLAGILQKIRTYLLSKGCEITFNAKVVEIINSDKKVLGVITSSVESSDRTKEHFSDYVIFSTGHSARDTYQMLLSKNVALEPKPFAIGSRVEHPAEFINKSQYGKFSRVMPAADYKLVFNNKKSMRSVFSFCMCPGGVVVNSSSEHEKLCVNGMSYSDRSMPNSNSALVATIKPDDFAKYSGNALCGIEFQRKIEASAYFAGKDQNKIYAPAISVTEFLNNFNKSNGENKKFISTKIKKLHSSNFSIKDSSYKPGVKESDFKNIFPDFITRELCRGIIDFDKKIPGFIENGILVGAETRTSSPVRILRNDNMESISHKNLYPIGEGAGYAGGIVSSAVDGLRAAEAIIDDALDQV